MWSRMQRTGPEMSRIFHIRRGESSADEILSRNVSVTKFSDASLVSTKF